MIGEHRGLRADTAAWDELSYVNIEFVFTTNLETSPPLDIQMRSVVDYVKRVSSYN